MIYILRLLVCLLLFLLCAILFGLLYTLTFDFKVYENRMDSCAKLFSGIAFDNKLP